MHLDKLKIIMINNKKTSFFEFPRKLGNNKKGFEISIRLIVIVIIAIAFLALAILFLKSTYSASSEKMKEVISAIPIPAPHAKINIPSDFYEVDDNITFDGSFSYDNLYPITDYFWNFGDGLPGVRGPVKTSRIYYEPGDYNVTLKVLNKKGGLGVDSVIVRVFSKNSKKKNMYEGNPIFIIPDKVTNWRDILQIVPLTNWYSKDTPNYIHENPYIVYYNPNIASFNNTGVKDILSSHNSSKTAYVFDSPYVYDEDYGNKSIKKISLSLSDYTSFWNRTESIVIVDYDDKDSALIASLFAGYYNAPLFFVNAGNLNSYKDYIKGKTVYIIPSVTSLDNNTYDFIVAQGNAKDNKQYSVTDLKNGTVNRIIKLNSEIEIK